MPGGVKDPVLGYATFCGIKFAGYTAPAHFLSRHDDGADHAAWKVGAVRTLIGMVAGALYLGLWLLIDGPAHFGRRPLDKLSYPYLAGLAPVRIAEWWLLIWLFYDRALRERVKGWRMVGAWNAVVVRSRCAGDLRLHCNGRHLVLLDWIYDEG